MQIQDQQELDQSDGRRVNQLALQWEMELVQRASQLELHCKVEACSAGINWQ
ncbi:MAG: hypothetical protein VX346_22795 [Planctomycetota bacterium]|nr:hypothetical protein [Planctomycetota bacterium]